MRRQSKLSAIALTIILAVSCGGGTLLRTFRVALASSSPLVTSLVASGTIPQSKASAIIADFDAGAQCGLTLQNQFNAISTGLPEGEKRVRKLQASQAALQCFRVIVNRQNFAANSKIQNAANIAEGILSALVAFYSDGGGRTEITVPISEDEFEKQLSKRVNALKEAMKP